MVILSIILSAGDSEFSSNAFRVYAWVTSIEEIQNSLYFGSAFEIRDLEGVSVNRDTIADQGIAESHYLYSALHYGTPAFIFYFLFLSILFIRSWNFCKNREWAYLAVPFGVIFVDRFYGSLLTSHITLTLVALIYLYVAKHKIRRDAE